MDDDRTIKKEFFAITRILPLRWPNLPEDGQIRRDRIFPLLAHKAFDHPKLVGVLLSRIRKWLSCSKSEFVYCLAGYVYYLNNDFQRSEFYFLRAIEKNPRNLDNWFDLAFSLYHQDKAKHELGKHILFNYPDLVDSFNGPIPGKCDLKTIKKLSKVAKRHS